MAPRGTRDRHRLPGPLQTGNPVDRVSTRALSNRPALLPEACERAGALLLTRPCMQLGSWRPARCLVPSWAGAAGGMQAALCQLVQVKAVTRHRPLPPLPRPVRHGAPVACGLPWAAARPWARATPYPPSALLFIHS